MFQKVPGRQESTMQINVAFCLKPLQLNQFLKQLTLALKKMHKTIRLTVKGLPLQWVSSVAPGE